MLHQKDSDSLCTIMPHYVKKLGRKNCWRKSRSVRVFDTKTVTAIFLGAWGIGDSWITICSTVLDFCSFI
jgi:hypothetical protein